jgi:TonB family protein
MICNSCGNVVDDVNRFCPKCGAAVQYQAPPPAPGGTPYVGPQSTLGGPAQVKRSSSCGKIILILVIIFVLLAAAIGAAIYFGYQYVENTLKTSEPYTVALDALKANAEVSERLGEITETGFPLGAYSQNNDGSGDAAFFMSVTGTKGNGKYQVELKRRNSVWELRTGTVTLPDGDVIRIESTPSFDSDANSNSNLDVDTDTTSDAVEGGDLTDKAISLPKPPYPPIARQTRASGQVLVQVVVDERGNVISARAISGHPLLQAAAVAAARQAKFSPTKVSGKAVKVSGRITYNFSVP